VSLNGRPRAPGLHDQRIAYHPIRHEWSDPFHGADDLEHKLIRSVGTPMAVPGGLPRILRALRFSARFDFRIHPRTLERRKPTCRGWRSCRPKRVRDEWFKGSRRPPCVEIADPVLELGAARILAAGNRKDGKREGETGNVDKLPRDPVLVTAYSHRIRLRSLPVSRVPTGYRAGPARSGGGGTNILIRDTSPRSGNGLHSG